VETAAGPAAPRIDTLANGVRVLTIALPQAETASVSVFVRSGSAHESAHDNGISHFVEHMVFKGTATRDRRQWNARAEALGAEVNAHTDKDHTAFHMRGFGRDALVFVDMLADLVRSASFPPEELEREREVLLQEFVEDEDDPMSTAYKLFDRASFGHHPAAQPVMGSRRTLERLVRADLVAFRDRQYTGSNVIVAGAGPIDPDAFVREAGRVFGSLAPGTPHAISPPAWQGGIRTRGLAGSSQSHAALGFPIAPLQADDPAAEVAAAVLGEGMSSPLMEELREKRGLVYYAACAADVLDGFGQCVIEASTAPERFDEFLRETAALVAAHARHVAADDLARAHHQVAVRRLRAHERPYRRLEDAALELFALGRVRSHARWTAQVGAISAERVRQTFEAMLAAGPALAVSGHVPRGTRARAAELLAPLTRRR
jgi:predicted Zn-dependent peptidase